MATGLPENQCAVCQEQRGRTRVDGRRAPQLGRVDQGTLADRQAKDLPNSPLSSSKLIAYVPREYSAGGAVDDPMGVRHSRAGDRHATTVAPQWAEAAAARRRGGRDAEASSKSVCNGPCASAADGPCRQWPRGGWKAGRPSRSPMLRPGPQAV